MSVNWNANVNTRVLRETNWSDVVGAVGDDTRSGVRKVRASNTFEPKSFSVKMRFTLAEFTTFKDWFEVTTRKGSIPFYFPDLEKSHANQQFSTNGNNKLYRFVPQSKLSYNNKAGNLIDVGMEWEEV